MHSSSTITSIVAMFGIVYFLHLLYREDVVKLDFCNFSFVIIFIRVVALLLPPIFMIISWMLRRITFAFLIISLF